MRDVVAFATNAGEGEWHVQQMEEGTTGWFSERSSMYELMQVVCELMMMTDMTHPPKSASANPANSFPC